MQKENIYIQKTRDQPRHFNLKVSESLCPIWINKRRINHRSKMQILDDLTIQHNWKKYIRENGSRLRKFSEQDLCTDSLIKVNATIPWELTYQILDELFELYFSTFNYDLIIELLMVNKNFLRRKYKEIYKVSQKASYVLFSRLRSTFRLLEDIHDNYIQAGIYTGNRKPYIRVESREYVSFEPWEYRFDNIIIMYNDMRPITQNRLRRSDPVPLYGSMVLLDTNAFLQIERVHYPLIDIIWCDQSGECNQDQESLKADSFIKFGHLLKKAYAPFARIQYVVPRVNDNPFLVHENSFIDI